MFLLVPFAGAFAHYPRFLRAVLAFVAGFLFLFLAAAVAGTAGVAIALVVGLALLWRPASRPTPVSDLPASTPSDPNSLNRRLGRWVALQIIARQQRSGDGRSDQEGGK